MTSESPSISVIIPAYNAEETIGQCLSGLTHQTIPSSEFEIIVVDDGSTDNTVELIKKHRNVRLARQAHVGPAVARNSGVVRTKGEFVLFTDADCVPKRDWIEKMIAPFAQQDIVGVKGRYLTDQKSLVARFVQLEYEDKYDKMRRQVYIDFIDTYSAGYRREVFLANEGFDPKFNTSSVEDQEFSFRLARQGLKMVFEDGAIVYHLGHASSLRSYFRKKFKIGYWKVWVHQLHPDKLVTDSHTPQVIKLQIFLTGLSVLLIILGFIDLTFLLFGAIGWIFVFISTLPFVAKAWRKDKSVAIISPLLLLFRALGLGLGLVFGIIGYSIQSVVNNSR